MNLPANSTQASLMIEIELVGDGWMVDAPWLDEAVHVVTWEEGYRFAIHEWRKRLAGGAA